MNQVFRRLAVLAAVAGAAVGSGACGSNTLGTLGQVLGSAIPGASQTGTGQIAAQVRQINTNQRIIQVTTTDGQTGNIYYDQNTVVVYQQQQYPVTSLEQGDRITMQVQQTSQNQLYASRIDVTQSVQSASGQGTYGQRGQVVQLSGTVSRLDTQRGTFQLQTRTYGTVLITLPYNTPQATSDYFRRLRNGNTVRLEATPLGNGQYEIYRFL